jgi:tetratricopeptide (TPR) repeat protein
MNKKGVEWQKLINGILGLIVLVIIVGGVLYVFFRPKIAIAGGFGESAANALDKLKYDLFADKSKQTTTDIESSTPRKYMDDLYNDANRFYEGGRIKFNENLCSEAITNLKISLDKYNSYIKNCEDKKSKYYEGCVIRDKNNLKSYYEDSKEKIVLINQLMEKCKGEISTQSKLFEELSTDIQQQLKELEKDAKIYEDTKDYQKAINIWRKYINTLKEISPIKYESWVLEAYKSIIKDYIALGPNYYNNAFNEFRYNEDLKKAMPNEYRKVVLELAEPIDCKNRNYDNCVTPFNQKINLKLTYGLGYEEWILTKEDVNRFKKLNCFKSKTPFGYYHECVSCSIIHKCEDYIYTGDWGPGDAESGEEACKNDPCGIKINGVCLAERGIIKAKCTS